MKLSYYLLETLYWQFLVADPKVKTQIDSKIRYSISINITVLKLFSFWQISFLIYLYIHTYVHTYIYFFKYFGFILYIFFFIFYIRENSSQYIKKVNHLELQAGFPDFYEFYMIYVLMFTYTESIVYFKVFQSFVLFSCCLLPLKINRKSKIKKKPKNICQLDGRQYGR